MAESVAPRRAWIALGLWTALGLGAVVDVIAGGLENDWTMFGGALAVELLVQVVLATGLWLRLWPARPLHRA